MTKNRTPTPVYLDPGMHSGLEVKGLSLKQYAGYNIFHSWEAGLLAQLPASMITRNLSNIII